MTLGELREIVSKTSRGFDDLEVKVWLPGSRLSLHGAGMSKVGEKLLIEGSLDRGSALP